jgi:hypothetical protein
MSRTSVSPDKRAETFLSEIAFGKKLGHFRREATRKSPVVLEREMHFVMRFSRLKAAVDLSGFDRRLIIQHYFPQRRVKLAVHALCRLRGIEMDVADELDLTKARLRQFIKPGHPPKYYLEAKGPRGEHGRTRTECPELPSRLSRYEYYALRPLATAGYARKIRFRIPGEARDLRGNIHPLRLQADVWLAAGKRKDALRHPSQKLDMVTIDLELPRRDLVIAIRAWDHNFHFLHEAKELTRGEKPRKRALGNRRLAREGFDDFARRAVKKLLRS